MKARKRLLAAVAAFGFGLAFLASAAPALNPCQACRASYNHCLASPDIDDALCEDKFVRCLLGANCPLE